MTTLKLHIGRIVILFFQHTLYLEPGGSHPSTSVGGRLITRGEDGGWCELSANAIVAVVAEHAREWSFRVARDHTKTPELLLHARLESARLPTRVQTETEVEGGYWWQVAQRSRSVSVLFVVAYGALRSPHAWGATFFGEPLENWREDSSRWQSSSRVTRRNKE